ncbi:MAG TPA: trehalase family glycosidase [Capsulimonadaceae bacterium]|jgi:hypothetical protein
MEQYSQLKRRLGSGWNTWNVRSVLSHVWLGDKPDEESETTGDNDSRGGFALNLALFSYADGSYLKETLIGRETVRPGAHATDGSYTDLTLSWKGSDLRVESAHDGKDLVVLITPTKNPIKPPALVIEAGLLWNRAGCVRRVGDTLVGHVGEETVSAYITGEPVEEYNIPAQAAYLAVPLTEEIGLSTGRRRSISEIQAAIITRRAEQHRRRSAFGRHGDAYDAIQSCLAWDTIYEPSRDRVISPVSRTWSVREGGWVLFCWDTFFAGLLASIDSKDLAYANAIEIVQQMIWEDVPTGDGTPPLKLGFVPNFSTAYGSASRDRSQPPVGSYVVLELFRKFGDKWLLELLFDDLLAWNRWWADKRDNGGLLSWGSQPYEPRVGNFWETEGVGNTYGAALESGLDNSPMYDDIPVNKTSHLLELADVGLTGLYIWDCDCLADIAKVLGRREEGELRARADRYRGHCVRLWSEEDGFYYNRRTDTDKLSRRISPTNFYAMLGRVASPAQAERIVNEHLLNESEFWGEWVLPSISRDDPAYKDNTYWRGRIWAPMNFLVYVGLQHYDLPGIRRDFAAKSEALLLKEWRSHRHVHENYNAETGEGCDVHNSDPFYHWGGLLGMVALMEAGL